MAGIPSGPQVVDFFVKVVGRSYTGVGVSLDNTSFEQCKFKNCTLFYSGGPAQIAPGNYFENCRWQFQGAAAITMQVIQQLGWKIESPQ